MVKNVLCLWHD